MGLAAFAHYMGKWGLMLSGGRFEPLDDNNILLLHGQLKQYIEETGLEFPEEDDEDADQEDQ